MSELENMTLLELRNFAKEQNIKNISKLKKEELVVLLRQVAETSKPQEKIKEEIKYDRDDEEQFEKTVNSALDISKNVSILIFTEKASNSIRVKAKEEAK